MQTWDQWWIERDRNKCKTVIQLLLDKEWWNENGPILAFLVLVLSLSIGFCLAIENIARQLN